MKKTSFVLLSLFFVNASWATNTKGLLSKWVSQNNEELDFTKCTQAKVELPKDSVAYECPVTFTTSEGICTTQFGLVFSTKKPNEGAFVVDAYDSDDDTDDENKPETCAQKRYGETGTFRVAANTLRLTAVSTFWIKRDTQDPDFKGDPGMRVFDFK